MALAFTYQPPKLNGAAVMAERVKLAEIAGATALLKAAVPLVPKDTEQLADSGHVDPHAGVGAAVVFDAVSDDGYPYGVRQHEDESLNHPNGGQAHYLSDPMRTEGPAILAAMAKGLRF